MPSPADYCTYKLFMHIIDVLMYVEFIDLIIIIVIIIDNNRINIKE